MKSFLIYGLITLCTTSIAQTNIVSTNKEIDTNQVPAVSDVKGKILSVSTKVATAYTNSDTKYNIFVVKYTFTTERPRISAPTAIIMVLFEDDKGVRTKESGAGSPGSEKEQNSSTFTKQPIVFQKIGHRSKINQKIIAVNARIFWETNILDSYSWPDENTLKEKQIDSDWFKKRIK